MTENVSITQPVTGFVPVAGAALGVQSDSVGEDIQDKATKAHKDEIDVLAWSWGASQKSDDNSEGAIDESTTKMMSTGSGAGKANFQDLSLSTGGSGGEDRLTENLSVRKSGGDAPIEYIQVATDPKKEDWKWDAKEAEEMVADPKAVPVDGEVKPKATKSDMYLKIGPIKGESQDK